MKKIFKYSVKRYLEFLCENNQIEFDFKKEKNILIHINSINAIILFFIKVYFYFISAISLLIFFKKFSRLETNQIQVLLKILFLFNFVIKRINQVLLFICLIHIYGKE